MISESIVNLNIKYHCYIHDSTDCRLGLGGKTFRRTGRSDFEWAGQSVPAKTTKRSLVRFDAKTVQI